MKNWTLRHRILASFAVIIAIMLLMIVASYTRLQKIEESSDNVRTDSVPGVFYSSMIRSSFVDSFVYTQQLIGLSYQRELITSDEEQYKAFADRLDKQIAQYEGTIQDPADRAAFAEFKRLKEAYTAALTRTLEAYREKKFIDAQDLAQNELTPAWTAGRKALNAVIELNSSAATNATRQRK